MIDPQARIECEELIVGEGTIIRAHAHIYGKRVVLGRECFIDEHAVIGGGSAGNLTAGDWLHMGMFSQVNTARDVTIGDEVGIGIGTRIFTHGAYLSEWDGFPCSFAPVTIGSRVWLPNAQVNPGVTIGSDVVVAAGSVVTKDIPSGSMAAGIPAKVIGPSTRPADRTAILESFGWDHLGPILYDADTAFDLECREIVGRVTEQSEALKNDLRRHGIRFRYSAVDGYYRAWT